MHFDSQGGQQPRKSAPGKVPQRRLQRLNSHARQLEADLQAIIKLNLKPSGLESEDRDRYANVKSGMSAISESPEKIIRLVYQELAALLFPAVTRYRQTAADARQRRHTLGASPSTQLTAVSLSSVVTALARDAIHVQGACSCLPGLTDTVRVPCSLVATLVAIVMMTCSMITLRWWGGATVSTAL